jgi:hypothetical protein
MPSLNTKLATAPNTSSNYVLKATTSTTIGNSLIFDNGTNVGINTTSPATYTVAPQFVLDTGTSGGGMTIKTGTTSSTTNYGGLFFADGTTGTEQYRGFIQYSHNFNSFTDTLIFGTAGSERMYINSAGNVGIGTSSPSYRLETLATSATIAAFGTTSASGGFLQFRYSTSSNFGYIGTGNQLASGSDVTDFAFANDAGNIVFATSGGFTERMRIRTDGNVLIGGSNLANLGTTNRIGAFRVDSAGEVYLQLATTGQSTVNHAFFYNSTGLGGSIRTSSGTISLVNGSDYRMKTNIESLTEGLSIISKLKPCTFEYIATEGSKFEGFIAHELQEIIPNAVFGEKDAINEDGTPNYQGIDTVKIIPYLVKAIQEQQKQIEELKQLVK